MPAVRHASAGPVPAVCRSRRCDVGQLMRERTRARRRATTCRSKSADYNDVMKEKMRWDQDAPYDYRFERGLYYHHILENVLLCGSQPTSPDDIRYLKEVETVDTIISVCPCDSLNLCTHSCSVIPFQNAAASLHALGIGCTQLQVPDSLTTLIRLCRSFFVSST